MQIPTERHALISTPEIVLPHNRLGQESWKTYFHLCGVKMSANEASADYESAESLPTQISWIRFTSQC
jgi:hypothetical protein